MAKELSKLKLGKSAAFVKTHLKQLKQENDTWEADFRALPKPKGQRETHYLGLVVALPRGNPLVCFPLLEYTPNANDLADLLADAMRRPMTDSAHRPRRRARPSSQKIWRMTWPSASGRCSIGLPLSTGCYHYYRNSTGKCVARSALLHKISGEALSSVFPSEPFTCD